MTPWRSARDAPVMPSLIMRRLQQRAGHMRCAHALRRDQRGSYNADDQLAIALADVQLAADGKAQLFQPAAAQAQGGNALVTVGIVPIADGALLRRTRAAGPPWCAGFGARFGTGVRSRYGRGWIDGSSERQTTSVGGGTVARLRDGLGLDVDRRMAEPSLTNRPRRTTRRDVGRLETAHRRQAFSQRDSH